MNFFKKRSLLNAIDDAADLVESGELPHTCTALIKAGVPQDLVRRYWDVLMALDDGLEDFVLETRLGRLHRAQGNYSVGFEPVPYYRSPEARDHRLLMLAWLYEMVRSGDLILFPNPR